MNPFLFKGQTFLIFYLVLGVSALFLLKRWLGRVGSNPVALPSVFARDPYRVAYLRGGKLATITVATVSLNDRGMLFWDGETHMMAKKSAIDMVKRPIEKALLDYYATPKVPSYEIKSKAIDLACGAYESELRASHLLADWHSRLQRLFPCAIVFFLLAGIGFKKIGIALDTGHSNIGFLILLMIIYAITLLGFFFARLTPEGAQLLSNLQSLFSLLKTRAPKLRAGGETNEVALVSAVFGITVLSEAAFPFMSRLMPSRNSNSCSSSSDSSSGSCGSSCGGGCGGCGG